MTIKGAGECMACAGFRRASGPNDGLANLTENACPKPIPYGQWAAFGAGLHISTATCHALHLAISAAVLPKR